MGKNVPVRAQSINFTQNAAERTKSYCTSQTPGASLSTLNAKIRDKILKTQQV